MHIQVKSEISNGETIVRMMTLDKTFKRRNLSSGSSIASFRKNINKSA